MKKLTTLGVLLSFVLLNAYGQEEKIFVGIKGGLNIASITNTGVSGSSSSFGYSSSYSRSPKFLFHLGLYSEFKLASVFAIQPELLYTMGGYSRKSKTTSPSSSSESNYSLTLSYINIPIQAKIYIKNFYFLAGPYVGFLLGMKDKSKNTVTNSYGSSTSTSSSTDMSNYNTVDIGAYFGIGYQLDNGVNFGLRWCKGFTNIYNIATSQTYTNSVFQFSLGYPLIKK